MAIKKEGKPEKKVRNGKDDLYHDIKQEKKEKLEN